MGSLHVMNFSVSLKVVELANFFLLWMNMYKVLSIIGQVSSVAYEQFLHSTLYFTGCE